MLKNILKLEGIQELTKKEQKKIKAGYDPVFHCDESCTNYGNAVCDCSGGTWSGQ